MAEPADINVDELRRRARRRLVGAVVLALAVAVIVPMLLESRPKPLGDDVSVKIPPVDDGKFINRLSGSPTGAAQTPAPGIGSPAPAKAPGADAAVAAGTAP
ncbi:MAG TPA: SPOR domain-containing protein, partial [Casimicrobiaceae bacterium]|nr:SPOR domain-containing protein [Casimicrobiaceae bacterium]